MAESEWRTVWRRRLAGWLWILAWAAVLYTVASPGQSLGGLVGERLRWLERFVLGCGLVIGFRVGSLGRRAARPGRGRSHAGLLRWILWPVAAATAAGMIALRAQGQGDWIRVLSTGFAAYWAGIDLGFGAYPLACGLEYSLTRPIRPPPDGAGAGPDPEELPPWLGL